MRSNLEQSRSADLMTYLLNKLRKEATHSTYFYLLAFPDRWSHGLIVSETSLLFILNQISIYYSLLTNTLLFKPFCSPFGKVYFLFSLLLPIIIPFLSLASSSLIIHSVCLLYSCFHPRFIVNRNCFHC